LACLSILIFAVVTLAWHSPMSDYMVIDGLRAVDRPSSPGCYLHFEVLERCEGCLEPPASKSSFPVLFFFYPLLMGARQSRQLQASKPFEPKCGHQDRYPSTLPSSLTRSMLFPLRHLLLNSLVVKSFPDMAVHEPSYSGGRQTAADRLPRTPCRDIPRAPFLPSLIRSVNSGLRCLPHFFPEGPVF